MSLVNIYVVYDRASKHYGSIHNQKTDAEAIRSFSQVVNEPGNQISNTPDDFTLFSIGQFDQNIGELTSWEPVKITNGAEVKKVHTVEEMRQSKIKGSYEDKVKSHFTEEQAV